MTLRRHHSTQEFIHTEIASMKKPKLASAWRKTRKKSLKSKSRDTKLKDILRKLGWQKLESSWGIILTEDASYLEIFGQAKSWEEAVVTSSHSTMLAGRCTSCQDAWTMSSKQQVTKHSSSKLMGGLNSDMVFLNLVVQKIIPDTIQDFMRAWLRQECRDFRIVFIGNGLDKD